jgi:hypothetical protein
MLDYGGRLRSLLHKASGRELVEVNPVFQPLVNYVCRYDRSGNISASPDVSQKRG